MKGRDYRDYIKDILDSINDIENFTRGMAFKKFLKDKKTVNAVIRSIEIIGEASKKIPNSLKKKYIKIPWKKMAGMRDKVIHEYFGVDLNIVWKTIEKDIPELKRKVRKLKSGLDK